MTGKNKERLEEMKKDAKYLVNDAKYYRPIYLDGEEGILVVSEVSSKKNLADDKVKTFQEIEDGYGLNVQIQTERVTPDQYFLNKIKDPKSNMLKNVSSKRLIDYMLQNENECKEAEDSLKNIALNSCEKNVRKAAYQTCKLLGLVDDEFSREYQKLFSETEFIKKPSSHKSKLYNPPVGEFGFCCEEEKVAIVFDYMKKGKWNNFASFEANFRSHYEYERSLLNDDEVKKLYDKYYDYMVNGGFEEIQNKRKDRINSFLPEDLTSALEKYGLKATRADGRGTHHVHKKGVRKHGHDHGSLSGYRIISIKKGIPVAGKKYELYEDDVRDFISKLESHEIDLDDVLKKERG